MGEVATIPTEAVSRESAVLSVITRAASDPSVDIEKLERLLAMQERIAQSQAQALYNADMAAMQARMPSISKDAKIVVSGQVRATYASFENIVSTIRPLLEQYGFSVTFKTSFVNETLHVLGRISHRAGHSEETTIQLPFDSSGSKNDVQAIGSSVSYGKRYALCMLLNIATGGEDDDGNSAQRVNERDIYGAARRHMDAVMHHSDSIGMIKNHLNEQDYRGAAMLWCEFDEDTQRALWLAYTKGGVFTTAERAAIKDKCSQYFSEFARAPGAP